MYIKYPDKFVVKVDYRSEIITIKKNDMRKNKSKDKDNKPKESEYNSKKIYEVIDEEYACEQTERL